MVEILNIPLTGVESLQKLAEVVECIVEMPTPPPKPAGEALDGGAWSKLLFQQLERVVCEFSLAEPVKPTNEGDSILLCSKFLLHEVADFLMQILLTAKLR
mmetsp:Transcript_90601/g.194271  ORF Transcript_90601/g.194271 Transcript_90601/m.194271 type:complete len:101 (-) Transcript_90601:801-1103(-)